MEPYLNDQKENIMSNLGKIKRDSMGVNKIGKLAEDLKEKILVRKISLSEPKGIDKYSQIPPETNKSTKKRSILKGWSSTVKNSLRKRFGTLSTIRECNDTELFEIFGVELEECLLKERLTKIRTNISLVPQLIHICLQYLFPAFSDEEGLFRISGMQDVVLELRTRANRGEYLNFEAENISCHTVSGLLKLYIRELPSPLYPKIFQAELLELCSEEPHIRKSKMKALIERLPDVNYAVLKKLTKALHEFSKNSLVTKMNSANLATVWAPNLIWDKDFEKDPQVYLEYSRLVNQCIQYTIDNFEELFVLEAPYEHIKSQPSIKKFNLTDWDPMRMTTTGVLCESELESTNEVRTLPGSHVVNIDDSLSKSANGSTFPVINGNLISNEISLEFKSNKDSTSFEPEIFITPSRKRPRSIWIGNTTVDENKIDSNSEKPTRLYWSRCNLHRAETPREMSLGRCLLNKSITSSLGSQTTISLANDIPQIQKRRKVEMRTEMPKGMRESRGNMLEDNTTPQKTIDKKDSLKSQCAYSDSKKYGSPLRPLQMTLRKSMRLNNKTERSLVSREARPLTIYYYSDLKPESLSLKRLIVTLQITPMEIRNFERDKMSWDECMFFARNCTDLVVVKRYEKPYTVSFLMKDLTDEELRQEIQDERGDVSVPMIIFGNTLMIGYDKSLKEIYKYYIFKKDKMS